MISQEEKEDIKDIKMAIARIETALLGDEKASIPGIASRVKDLEAYKENDKKLKNKVAGAVMVGTPVLVLLWDAFKDWFKSLTHL